MPDKRKASMSAPSPKRLRISNEDGSDTLPSMSSHDRPRNNPIYGQKSAFPGLDDGGDELFYGPADDGLEYLRMVRSEANSLPSLFIAPIARIGTERLEADTQSDADAPELHKFPAGFFEDEAYVAPVEADKESVAATDQRFPDAQVSYYNLLRHRFLLLRSTLRCTPPATAIAALDDAHPISLPDRNTAARKEWRRLLLTVEPRMVQLACMDLDSILRVLSILARGLGENVRAGDADRIRRLGAWAWALLGKCREVGELATNQVGELRDLGKRAVKILHRMQETESKRSAEESDASDSEAGDGEEAQTEEAVPVETPSKEALGASVDQADAGLLDDTDLSAALEAAKSRLQAKLQSKAAPEVAAEVNQVDGDDLAQQARALLDMIITIVGEFFGQRDLLDAREVWGRDDAMDET
ncbi:uncharacterized protein N7482_000631 [Penicillium canariense]|uniref:V-SNARE n=1 Tax=Penicillium canariense TaxID=189055 RepID=A0A9W9LT48_9EURO|nr:uncharacterized protein N7482_000631 [Penicillium canariense]KAJ5174754.1 hypothetical protein N7482_000631 [Penicillium canariense]